jgi:hypothetical protein
VSACPLDDPGGDWPVAFQAASGWAARSGSHPRGPRLRAPGLRTGHAVGTRGIERHAVPAELNRRRCDPRRPGRSPDQGIPENDISSRIHEVLF